MNSIQNDSLIETANYPSYFDIIILDNQDKEFNSFDKLKGIAILLALLFHSQSFFDNQNKFYPFILPDWNGVAPVDFVFPFFIYIVGINVFLIDKNELKKLPFFLKKLGSYSFLFFLGVCFNYFQSKHLFTFNSLLKVSYTSYLFKYSITYLILMCLHLLPAYFSGILTGILVIIYYLFLYLFPLKECDKHEITNYCNFDAYIDRIIFSKNHMKYPTDSEGFFSTFPCLYIAYNGYLLTYIMKGIKKVSNLIRFCITFGITLINILFFCISLFVFSININHKIYSISFIFMISMTTNSIFIILYFLEKRITFLKFLEIIGVNYFLIYLILETVNVSLNFINFQNIFDTPITKGVNLAFSVIVTVLLLLFSFFLHKKKKIFKGVM